MRCWETASTSSPTIATSWSSASVSSVTSIGPSSEFSIGTIAAVDAAVVDGEDRVAHGREADELGVAAVQRGARGLLGERARRTEVAQPHQGPLRHHDASAMRSASSSSGESLSSPLPSETCLAYSRAWSRWWIEDSTTPLRALSSSAIEVDWRPDISL